MGDLLAHVLPLALGAAISPTILILSLMLLSDATYGRVRSAVFTLGAGLVLAGFSVFAYVVIKPVSSAQAQPDAFFGWLDLVAGVALIGLGVRALVTPPKPPKERPAGAEASAHAGEWFAVGAGAMLTNFSTLVLYLPAVKDVAVSSVDAVAKVAVVVVLWIITMALAWVPLLAVVVFGDRAVEPLRRLRAAITAHQKTVAAVVSFAFGAYLGIKGIRAVA